MGDINQIFPLPEMLSFHPTLSHNSELLTFTSAEVHAVLVNLYPLASQSFADHITPQPWVIHLCNLKIYHLYPSLESVSVWLEALIGPASPMVGTMSDTERYSINFC